MITSEQLRAARAMLRWEQKDLAAASKVSLPSIKRLEGLPGELAAHDRTIDALRAALEAEGVVFVGDDGNGPGVRLTKSGAAGHAYALEQAEASADRQLGAVEASDAEKARRKGVVTQISKPMRTKT